jgi:hypothetical protein
MNRLAGEGLGHQVDGVAPPAADVGDVDSRGEAVERPRHEREDAVDQRRVMDRRAVHGHRGVKALVGAVGHAAAAAEALHHLLLDGGQQRDELHHVRQVVRAGVTGQRCGVLGRQGVRALVGGVRHDPARGHGPEPLTHVALVEPGGVGDLLARGRGQQRKRVEQSDLVADADHQRQRGVAEDADKPASELLRRGRIDFGFNRVRRHGSTVRPRGPDRFGQIVQIDPGGVVNDV